MFDIEPKHKHAMIISASGSFMPGLNGLINSFDYYGNEADIFIIIEKQYEESYMKKVEAAKDLNSTIFCYFVEDLVKNGWTMARDWKGCFVSYRYRLASEIAEKYESVVVMEADELVLTDIMKYFEIAAKTDFIILPRNFSGWMVENVLQDSERKTKKWSAGMSPFRNTPLFVNGHIYKEFLASITTEAMADGCGTGDMEALNQCLAKQDLLSKVFELPNILWDFYDRSQEWMNMTLAKNGKTYVHVLKGERMNVIHSKYWDAGVCKGYYAPNHNHNANVMNNIKLHWNLWRKFNMDWKIKMDSFDSFPTSL